MTAKSSLFLKLARPYVRRKLKKQFSDVRLSGSAVLTKAITEGPVILACNHVSWWDPLLLVHLDAVLKSDGYCIMDEAHLKQLPFFRWVGALPIDRSSASHAYRDIAAAGSVLTGPGRILAIFPQGEQRPAHLPLHFKPGVAALAAQRGAAVVPLAIRYDYLESPRQVVHLEAGAQLRCGSDARQRQAFLADLEREVTHCLARIDEHMLEKSQGYVSLLGRRPRAAEFDRIPSGAAALKLLARETNR